MTIDQAIHAKKEGKTVTVYLEDIDKYVKAKVLEVKADTEEASLEYLKPVTHVGTFSLDTVHEGDPNEFLVDIEDNFYEGNSVISELDSLLEMKDLDDIKLEMEKAQNDEEFISSRALDIVKETGISLEEARIQAEREFDVFVNTQELWEDEVS